jgi:hypothetical protein
LALLTAAHAPAAALGAGAPAQTLSPAQTATPAQTTTSAQAHTSALLLFLPGAGDGVQARLAAVPTLSTGLMSATQGSYDTAQLLLDITQGARVSPSAYAPHAPPPLSIVADRAGAAVVEPWAAVRKRAERAPQILQPGLLTGSIPGGGGYAGITGERDVDATVAADRGGAIASVSLGSAGTVTRRIDALSRTARLVVADLPGGALGATELRRLTSRRPSGELLIVVQRVPDSAGHELLWVAVGGLGGRRTLSSETTNEHGLIAAVDLAPTILAHLGLATPAAMRGKLVHTDGPYDGAALRALKARLPVVSRRRLPALAWLLGAWLALLLLAFARLIRWREPRRARAWSLRVGGLALLWAPTAVLIPAALGPSAPAEYGLLVLACFTLGALTDRLAPWPRAPLAPAIVGVLAIAVDALAGTQLLMRSLLGPNPIFGARFYGIGNELKSFLAVLVFAAVAAALYPAVHGRRAALTMLAAGVVLAVVEGSARIGAGVGGVILVSAGAAVATALLLPGQVTRRRLLIVLISPLLGLVALAALDLLTAHGNGHFTGSVLHARSAGDLRDLLKRRYGAAYDELRNGGMPYATALALLLAGLGLRMRGRIGARLDGDPAWLAALAGGLTAGVVGALSEDSGPVLLVVAMLALGCVLAYLWGRPPRQAQHERARTATA